MSDYLDPAAIRGRDVKVEVPEGDTGGDVRASFTADAVFCFFGTSSGNGNVFHQSFEFSWRGT